MSYIRWQLFFFYSEPGVPRKEILKTRSNIKMSTIGEIPDPMSLVSRDPVRSAAPLPHFNELILARHWFAVVEAGQWLDQWLEAVRWWEMRIWCYPRSGAGLGFMKASCKENKNETKQSDVLATSYPSDRQSCFYLCELLLLVLPHLLPWPSTLMGRAMPGG